jgi:hypothetical protein
MRPVVSGAARLAQACALCGREQFGPFGKGGGVFVDIAAERRNPGRGLGARRVGMRCGDRAAERVGKRRIDAASLGEMIERLGVVEAVHLDGPLHRRPAPIEFQPAVVRARNRDHAAVKLRCEAPIDRDLGLAGGLALVERRKVQEGKTHRALDLEHPLARHEHRRGVGVDAFDLRPAVGRRVGEQRKHRLLRVLLRLDLIHGRLISHIGVAVLS